MRMLPRDCNQLTLIETVLFKNNNNVLWQLAVSHYGEHFTENI